MSTVYLLYGILVGSAIALLLICLHRRHDIKNKLRMSLHYKCIRASGEAEQQIHYLEEENNKLKIRWRKTPHVRISEYSQVWVEPPTYRRLSGVMSDRMRDNNPDIVNLNDPFRPNKLAEISSEIYDNEWTDAFNVLEKTEGITETKAIRMLLDIVMVTYMVCKTRADQQWKEIVSLIGEAYDETTLRVKQTLQDGRKRKAETLFPDVKQAIISTLVSQHGDRPLDRLNTEGPVEVYLDACISLRCHMVVQCPPSVWYCPGWKHIELSPTETGTINTGDGGSTMDIGENSERNDTTVASTEYDQKIKFEKKLFREYMRAGHYIEYVLWPAMLQYEDGPTVSKGVAQGCS